MEHHLSFHIGHQQSHMLTGCLLIAIDFARMFFMDLVDSIARRKRLRTVCWDILIR